MGLRMMCITAHPDDESAAFGGTLLMAHAQGIVTSVVCLTDGQAATFRGEATDGAELGALRREEFAAASSELGVTHAEVLEFQDGKLPRVDFYHAAGEVVRRIRQYRPQVILTFGGEGGVNLHRDHTMVSLLATAAFHWAGRNFYFPEHISQGLEAYAPQKLYAVHAPFLASSEAAETTAITPCSLKLKVDEYKQKKLDAFLLHHTQRGVLERLRDVFEKHGGEESYLLIASRRNSASDTSLFSGVSED